MYCLCDCLRRLWGDHSDWFPRFGIFLFIRKIELGVGRVVAKEGFSLFGELQLSIQAKRCDIRPCPASKTTEGEELEWGEKYMWFVNTVNLKLIKLTYLACYN